VVPQEQVVVRGQVDQQVHQALLVVVDQQVHQVLQEQVVHQEAAV
jgi:hypothetical protein